MPDPAPTPGDALRARIREIAADSLASGRPTAWFERVYRDASGDPTQIPWADRTPNPALVAWTDRPDSLRGVRTCLVVGCGLGHDAEHLAFRGLQVVAFDVAAEAIAWARRIHPRSLVAYEVADLLAPPAAWRAAFDLVVEVHTLQALPGPLRAAAGWSLASLVAPGGRAFVHTRVVDAPPRLEEGPPWPLTRSELAEVLRPLAIEGGLVEETDAADPRIVRASGVFRAPSD